MQYSPPTPRQGKGEWGRVPLRVSLARGHEPEELLSPGSGELVRQDHRTAIPPLTSPWVVEELACLATLLGGGRCLAQAMLATV